MRNLQHWLSLALIAVTMTACAAQSLDSVAAKNIHRIALVGPSGPETYVFRSEATGTAGILLGPVGFAAAYAVTQAAAADTPAQFTTLMRQRNSEAVTELANATEAALREKGYEIIRVPVSRSAASDNLDVAALPQVDADTILDLSFTAGFIDHGEGGKWVPLVLTTIRAYNSSTRSLLFRVTIGCFGGSPKPEYARFQFEHMADVLIRPDDAADGLKHCSQLLGPLVAKRFGS